MKAKPPSELRDGVQCKVIGGVHAGQSGILRDIKTGKTGHVSIPAVEPNGKRFKTLAKNIVIQYRDCLTTLAPERQAARQLAV